MLSTEESLFKRMMDQSDETFLIFDVSAKEFIYTSPSFKNIIQRDTEPLLTNPASFLSIIHAEDQKLAKKVFKRLLLKKTNSLLDFRILRPDKSERWIRLKVYPLLQNGKTRYLSGILEDDTARKTSIFNMQKVTGWKDSLLEVLAHELRGPIGIVKMLASSIAKTTNGGENQQVQKWTKMIEDISQKNLDLIHSLIKKESLESAKVKISKERVDLVWEIAEIMNVYKTAMNGSSKQFEFSNSHEYIYARVDGLKFSQIINNLISNAIKFTKSDGLIKVHLEKLETTVLVTVTDNGIGIPKSLFAELFNKYTKASRKGLDGQESVGLGMWIVKSFTEAHNGKVWLESQENKGSTFYVEIPFAEDDFNETA